MKEKKIIYLRLLLLLYDLIKREREKNLDKGDKEGTYTNSGNSNRDFKMTGTTNDTRTSIRSSCRYRW